MNNTLETKNFEDNLSKKKNSLQTEPVIILENVLGSIAVMNVIVKYEDSFNIYEKN